MTTTTRVALVGTGFIAEVHLKALAKVPAVRVVAVCDAAPGKAERFAQRHGIGRWHASVRELLEAGGIDVVHVLVPPEHHVAVALECLSARVHVLVEKPLALREEDFARLEEVAADHGVQVGVNHNQTFHPAVARLMAALDEGHLGKLEHVALEHNVPLRQLQTGDVGHFMFRTEANILWEQGVHLFSIVHELLGPVREAHASTGPARVLGNGQRFFDEWQVSLLAERGSASVRMAFGRGMPHATLVAIGSDGVATLDLVRGAMRIEHKTRWLDPLDHALNLFASGARLVGRSCGTLVGYLREMFGVGLPDDPFIRGMRDSLAAFHAAIRGGMPVPRGIMAARSVHAMCVATAQAAGASMAPVAVTQLADPGPARPREVVVTGGTGTIGRRCVERLLAQGRPVTLLVRRPHLLAPELAARCRVFRGDAADPKVLAAACAGADAVLHLATCAGDDPASIPQAMAAATQAVGDACRAQHVRRLVFASSTAALYLGDRAPVDGSTGTDPVPAHRPAYARGKIAAEAELARQRAQGLETVVLRPAIVLSAEGPKDHSGAGLWVRDTVCVGWGPGNTPLPLVLADDVADACVAGLDSPAAANRSYVLAGGVQPTARAYVAMLRRHGGRPYRFVGQSFASIWLQEAMKGLLKRCAGRRVEPVRMRDLRSRAFLAPLRCDDAVRDLGFHPEADPVAFERRLFPADATGGTTQRLAFHVYATFGTGGAQVRAAQLMARMGAGWRHVVMAMDGCTDAVGLLPRDVQCEVMAPPPHKGFLAATRHQARVLRSLSPDLLVTCNWGAIETVAAARLVGLRAHVHHEDGFGPGESQHRFLRRNWMRRLLLRNVDVLVPSHTLERVARTEWGLGARLQVLPNGVDTERFQPQPVVDASTPVVGTVGGLRAEKDHATLLRAFARVPAPAQLRIVGSGPELPALQRLAAELGITARVTFTGARADVLPELQQLAVFAMSSSTEQMPICQLEAMACGLPVASTDVGDIRIMLPEGSRDGLVRPGDVDGLGRALAALCADPARRQREGVANRQHCVAHYELDACLTAWLAAYDRATVR